MKALLLFPFAPNKLARFIKACESDSVQLEIVANQNLTEGLPPNAIMTTATALSFAELSQSVSSLETYDGFVPFSEFSVLLADQVAQALGKPCNAIKDLECLTNKYAMRKSFENTGVLQPKVLKFLKRDEEIDKESLEELTFPVVVKPTDAAGSLNVKIVHSPEEVKTAIEDIRSFLYWKDAEVKFSGDAIIEEAIDGQEFSTEVIVQDAKVLFQSNTFKVMSAWPSTDELGHVLPYHHEAPIQSQVDKIIETAVKHIGFRHGVMNIEYKVKADEVFLIEIGYRIPGDRIADLTQMHYGISLERALIRARLGKDIHEILPKETADTYFYGIKFLFSGDVLPKAPSTVEHVIEKANWVKMTEINTSTSETMLNRRQGFVISRSLNLTDLLQFIGETRCILMESRAEDCFGLRHQVLRPHQSIENCHYPLDDRDDAHHVKIIHGSKTLAVGSIYHEDENEVEKTKVWRLRGMAVLPDFQGRGLGGHVLNSLIEYAKSQGAIRIWANARTTAAGLYLKHGFSQVGEEYDLPGLGPHLHLRIELTK